MFRSSRVRHIDPTAGGLAVPGDAVSERLRAIDAVLQTLSKRLVELITDESAESGVRAELPVERDDSPVSI